MSEAFDDEMYALLNSYATGSLTDEQRTRLFRKAISNQALFDALADEESLRDAFESPLVRRALDNAYSKMREERGLPAGSPQMARARTAAAPVPKPPVPATPVPPPPPVPSPVPSPPPLTNRWAWVALAACLVAATGTLVWWKQKEAPVVVSQAPKQESIKQESIKQESTAPLTVAPTEPPKPLPAKVPASVARKPESLGSAAPVPLAVPPPVAPPVAPAASAPGSPAPSSPAPAAVREQEAGELAARPAQSVVELTRDEQKPLAKRQATTAVRSRGTATITIRPGQVLYAFEVTDSRAVRSSLAGERTSKVREERRIQFPAEFQGELWVFVADAQDAALEQFADGGYPLPERAWRRLKP
jgi:hypothetical protein